LRGTQKSNGRAVAAEKWSGYGLSMKTSKPAIIAFVLWLLFFASHAFAVLKSPYPQKAYPPDQTMIVTGGYGQDGLGNVNQRKQQ
jgi:hypothetical protein